MLVEPPRAPWWLGVLVLLLLPIIAIALLLAILGEGVLLVVHWLSDRRR